MKKDSAKYQNIINLPYPIALEHGRMPLSERAAQFAPFAALTGFDTSIREAARFTMPRKEAAEDLKEHINRVLNYIYRHEKERLKVSVSVFVPDAKKPGGTYQRLTDRVLLLDPRKKVLCLEGGGRLFTEDIISIRIET